MSARHWGSDPHAGGGHIIATTGTSLRHLPDCPKCKYGTLDPFGNNTMRCVDCHAMFNRADLEKRGVVSCARWRRRDGVTISCVPVMHKHERVT